MTQRLSLRLLSFLNSGLTEQLGTVNNDTNMQSSEQVYQISKVNKSLCHCECSSVPVNLRLLVYRYGMKNTGTEASWEIMFERYLSATLAQEKDKLLYGLASIENVSLLNR